MVRFTIVVRRGHEAGGAWDVMEEHLTRILKYCIPTVDMGVDLKIPSMLCFCDMKRRPVFAGQRMDIQGCSPRSHLLYSYPNHECFSHCPKPWCGMSLWLWTGWFCKPACSSAQWWHRLQTRSEQDHNLGAFMGKFPTEFSSCSNSSSHEWLKAFHSFPCFYFNFFVKKRAVEKKTSHPLWTWEIVASRLWTSNYKTCRLGRVGRVYRWSFGRLYSRGLQPWQL